MSGPERWNHISEWLAGAAVDRSGGDTLRRSRESKYASGVALQDVGFAVDEERCQVLQVTFPLGGVEQVEQALQAGIITPISFLEPDGTQHQVKAFDPAPVGLSGHGEHIVHSVGLTDAGVFEISRAPSNDDAGLPGCWEWALDRRLVGADRVRAWQWRYRLSDLQIVDLVFETLSDADAPAGGSLE
jgi:hypothetical protein